MKSTFLPLQIHLSWFTCCICVMDAVKIFSHGDKLWCQKWPWTCKLISLGRFAAWRAKTNTLKHTILLLCYHMKCIAILLYLAMEISSSLRGAGYQVILFHLVMQKAVEPRKRFLKKAVCYCLLSLTSNIIFHYSGRPHVTLMDRNTDVSKNI